MVLTVCRESPPNLLRGVSAATYRPGVPLNLLRLGSRSGAQPEERGCGALDREKVRFPRRKAGGVLGLFPATESVNSTLAGYEPSQIYGWQRDVIVPYQNSKTIQVANPEKSMPANNRSILVTGKSRTKHPE